MPWARHAVVSESVSQWKAPHVILIPTRYRHGAWSRTINSLEADGGWRLYCLIETRAG